MIEDEFFIDLSKLVDLHPCNWVGGGKGPLSELPLS